MRTEATYHGNYVQIRQIYSSFQVSLSNIIKKNLSDRDQKLVCDRTDSFFLSLHNSQVNSKST